MGAQKSTFFLCFFLEYLWPKTAFKMSQEFPTASLDTHLCSSHGDPLQVYIRLKSMQFTWIDVSFQLALDGHRWNRGLRREASERGYTRILVLQTIPTTSCSMSHSQCHRQKLGTMLHMRAWNKATHTYIIDTLCIIVAGCKAYHDHILHFRRWFVDRANRQTTRSLKSCGPIEVNTDFASERPLILPSTCCQTA